VPSLEWYEACSHRVLWHLDNVKIGFRYPIGLVFFFFFFWVLLPLHHHGSLCGWVVSFVCAPCATTLSMVGVWTFHLWGVVAHFSGKFSMQSSAVLLLHVQAHGRLHTAHQFVSSPQLQNKHMGPPSPTCGLGWVLVAFSWALWPPEIHC
jgi:hypothetical protein